MKLSGLTLTAISYSLFVSVVGNAFAGMDMLPKNKPNELHNQSLSMQPVRVADKIEQPVQLILESAITVSEKSDVDSTNGSLFY